MQKQIVRRAKVDEGSFGRDIASGDENLAQVVEEFGNTQLGIVWPDRNDELRRGLGA